MPIKRITRGGVPVGYRYGQHGKLYLISHYGVNGAYHKAKRQASAIHANRGG